jgi:hypothetical protein
MKRCVPSKYWHFRNYTVLQSEEPYSSSYLIIHVVLYHSMFSGEEITSQDTSSVVGWLARHSRFTNSSIIGSPRLLVQYRESVTLRLADYRQSVRLSDKPLETHDQ